MKKILSLLLSVLMLATVCGGCALLPEEEEPLPVPVSNNPEVAYVTTPVMRGDLEDSVNFNARFAAVESVDVMFTTDGRVQQIHARKDDRVNEGDVLMELENEDELYALEQASIRLDIQRMKRNDVRQHNASGSTAYKIANLQMDLQQLEYDRLKEKVEQSYLYAPISGVVSYRIDDVTAGDYVEKNVRMYTIADTSTLVAESTYNDTKGLRKGMEVELYLGSVNLTFTGKILHLPNEKKENSDSAYGKIIIEIPESLQEQVADYYGQNLAATVKLDYLQDVLYVPENLVQTNGTTPYLRVLQDGVVVEKQVELGKSVKGYAVIESGVEEGDEVVYK